EENNPETKSDLQIAEELLEDPEFAQAAQRESFADRQVREHLEGLERAVRKGTRKATFASHQLLKRGKPSGRYLEPLEESLTDIGLGCVLLDFGVVLWWFGLESCESPKHFCAQRGRVSVTFLKGCRADRNIYSLCDSRVFQFSIFWIEIGVWSSI